MSQRLDGSQTKREIIAYHEASHAVVARKFDLAVPHVSAIDGVAYTASAIYLALEGDQTMQMAAIERDVIVYLAGPRGQHRHHPQDIKLPREWENDNDSASNLAYTAALIEGGIDVRQLDHSAVNFTPYQIEFAKVFFQRCSEIARKLVDEHWPAIERVAQALMICDFMDQAELDRVITG